MVSTLLLHTHTPAIAANVVNAQWSITASSACNSTVQFQFNNGNKASSYSTVASQVLGTYAASTYSEASCNSVIGSNPYTVTTSSTINLPTTSSLFGIGNVRSFSATNLTGVISLGNISKNFGDANFTVAASSNNVGAISYTSSNTSVATISGSTVTIVGTGTDTIKVSQVANGNYTACATAAILTVSTIAPTIGVFSNMNASIGAGFTITPPTSNSSGAFTYSSDNSRVVTISGTTLTPVGIGSCTITATQAANGNYSSGTTTASLTVSSIAPTITLSNITKNYGNANFILAASSNSSGVCTYSSDNLQVVTISGSTVTIVGVGTATITANQAAAGNYSSGSTTATLTVNAIAPTITLSNITKNYGDANFTLSASSNSSGTISYSSGNLGVATISGNTVSIVGVGTSTITVNQSANGNYTSGTTTATLTVSAIAPTFGTFTISSVNYGSGTFTLTAPSSNSAGAFTYNSGNTGVVSINGNTVTVLAAGTSTITATQAANGNYTAGSTTATLTVNTIAPTIGVFNNIAANYGASPITLTAPTSNSSGSFTFSSDNSRVVTTDVGSISGSTMTIVGAGTATITATQAANGNYTTGSTTAIITVNPIAPTISLGNISKNFGSGNFTLSAISNSAGAMTYSSDNLQVVTTSVAINNVTTVTIVGKGTATITVNQAANGNYTSGSTTATLTINNSGPTFGAFNDISVNYGSGTYTITPPSSNSAGAITYSSSNTAVATISGTTITILSAGTSTITANQAANGNYSSGSTTATLTVNPIAPTIGSFSNITKAFPATAFTLTAPTSNSSGAFAYSSDNSGVVTISGNTVTVVGPGLATITATQAANGNYTSATTTLTLSVTAQYYYTWIGGTSGTPTDYTVSTNWSPSRTSTATRDILMFSSNATVTNVPTQTIGRLVLQSNAIVSLQPASGGNYTLSVGNTNAHTNGVDDISIPAGCSLTLASNSDGFTSTYLTLALANVTGVTSNIAGTLTLMPNATTTAAAVSATAWTTNTTYAQNAYITNNNFLYKVTTAGSGGTSAPTGNFSQTPTGAAGSFTYMGTLTNFGGNSTNYALSSSNAYSAQYGTTTISGTLNYGGNLSSLSSSGTISFTNTSTIYLFNTGQSFPSNGSSLTYNSVNVQINNYVSSTGAYVISYLPNSVGTLTINDGSVTAGALTIISVFQQASSYTNSTTQTSTINNLYVQAGIVGFGRNSTSTTNNISTLTIGSGGVNVSGGILTLAYGQAASASSSINVSGGITLSNGTINLFSSSSNTQTASITASSFNQTSGTLNLNNCTSGTVSTGTLNISGDFTSSGGAFSQTAQNANNIANLVLNGTVGNQRFTGGGTLSNINIQINNTSSSTNNTVTLNSALTLNSNTTLKLNAGLLVLGSNNLTMNGAILSPTTPTSASYIVTNSTGNLVWNSVPSSGNTIFPIGTATSYAPLTFTGGTAGKNITVGVNSAFTKTVAIPNNVVNLQWSIQSSGLTQPTITFQYNTGDKGSGYSSTGTVLGTNSGTAYVETSLGTIGGTNPFTTSYTFTSNLPTTAANLYGIGNLSSFTGFPGAPTNVSAVVSDRTATVSFTPPSNIGASSITSYTVTSNPAGYSAVGSASPIVLPQIAGNTAYTFTVTATNSYGTGSASAASASVTTPNPTLFYVSPSGNDNNVGTINYPFLTISKAMTAISSGDTVYLRAGTYRETVNITTPSIAILGYPNEQAVISGTDVNNLTWTQTTINGVSVYRAPYSGAQFEQLFFNGKPMVQSRWPNLKTDTTGNWNFWDSTRWADAGNGSAYGIVVDESPNRLASAGFSSIVGAWAVLNVSHQYYTWTRAVTSHSGNTFNYASSGTLDSLYTAANSGRPYNGNRYYLVGMLQFLDTPGEWYNDTINNMLYFYPPNGLNPNTVGIEIKTRNYGLTAVNKDNLNIQNITIFGTAFQFNSLTGSCDTLTFKNNTVLYSSWTEFYGMNSGQKGYGNENVYPTIFSNKCTLTGNTFAYGAMSSLMISGLDNLIENNSFHDFDFNTSLQTPLLQISRNWNSYVGYAGNATVRYNDMYSSGGVVLQLGQDSNSIYYNHIYNGFLACYGGNIDVAMVYTCPAAPNNTSTQGTRIYNNWIHGGYAGSVHIYWGGGIGIRGDDSTSGLMIDHNVIWQVGGPGIQIKNSFNPVASQANFAYNNTSYSSSSYNVHTPPYTTSILLDATTSNENKYSLIKNNAGKGVYGGWNGYAFPYPSNVSNNYSSNALLPLVDSTNYDFRPTSGSALVDAGVVISGVTGYVSGSAPDAGAYEYGDTSYWIPGYRSSTTSFPIIPSGTTGVPITRDMLMWRPAYQGVSNKIYFGTSVANMTLQSTTPEEHNVFSLPTLNLGTTYYWRVDAVMANGTVVTGTVWSFTTTGTCTTGSYVGYGGGSGNDANNWCGGLPSATTNAIISNYTPILTSNLSVKNLTVSSGLNLNGYGLTINGNISGTGLLTGSPSSKITLAGTANGTLYFNQTISDSTNALDSLTISSSGNITLGNNLRLKGILSPGNSTFNSGGNLTLCSDSKGTARIDQVSGSISGNVTFQRYISAKTARKYSFLGSCISQSIRNSWQQQIYITGAGTGGIPCGNTTGNGGGTDTYNSNGFDATQNNSPSLFTYQATPVNGSRWVSVSNTTSTNLTPGIGYRVNVRGNRNSGTVTCTNQLTITNPIAPESVTLSETGTVTTGNVTVALNDTTIHKYTLLANPYPSQISFSAFQASNSRLYNKMWSFSPFGNGNYTTYAAGVITNGANGYDNTKGNYIASGQAFFVQANTNGNVVFQENHKIGSTIPNAKYFGNSIEKMVRVGLKTVSNDLLDEVVARFNANGSPNFNEEFDAASFNNSNQVLTLVKGGNELAIATFPENSFFDTLHLSVKSNSIGSFRLSFSDDEGFDKTTSVILVDKFLGISQNIRSITTYDFNVTRDTASIGANRFLLHVFKNTILPVKFVNFVATALPNANKLSWQINSGENNKGFEVQRKSETGDWVAIGFVNAIGNTVSYSFEDSIPTNLVYYRLVQTDLDGKQCVSKVVSVERNVTPLFKVWPNPTSDYIHLSLPTNNSGTLQTAIIKILSSSGKRLLNKTTTETNINIGLSKFAKDIYFIEIGIGGKTYRNKIVVQ